MKKHAGAADSSATSFTASIDNAANGTTFALTDTQTSALKKQEDIVYDIVITNTSSTLKTRVIEGSVLVREGVT